MQIPFVDLKAQYLSIKSEIDVAIQYILENANFIGGEQVQSFETAFASYIGTKHCIACANGTDSIEILLQAMGIKAGDEVLVPAISWISTSESVSNIGAVPIFVDVDDFFVINVDLIENKITEKTKAIIPVHLYGHPADMPKIMKIAQKYDLKVLEDCAQAHGAEINGRKIGTWGDCASFSFYPGKNLGAYGDAGAMLTNNEKIAEKARRIANHGQLQKHDHQIEGRNSRLDTIQAAILNTKLKYIEKWTEDRIKNAVMYSDFLNETDILCPKIKTDYKHVFHLYVIRSNRRDGLQSYLHEKGIQTAIHYPIALPFLPCYKKYGFIKTDFPIASLFQNEILSLPMYAELKQEQIQYIADSIIKF